MTYRVMTNEDLNYKSTDNGSGYTAMLESALNNMEADGFTLAHIEPPVDDTTESYYIFHKPTEKGARLVV